MKYLGPKQSTFNNLISVSSQNEIDDGEYFLEADNLDFLHYQINCLLNLKQVGEIVVFDSSSKMIFDSNYIKEETDNVKFGVTEIGARILKKGEALGEQLLPVCKRSDNAKKSLFLDRDGVIVHGGLYTADIDKVKINYEIVPFLKSATESDIQIFIVTNQSGVGRGNFSEEELKELHYHLQTELEKSGVRINHWFYSPFHTVAKGDFQRHSLLRKPLPGMVMWACEKYGIDIETSLMIGDRETDQLLLPGLKASLIKYKDQLTSPHFESFKDLFEDSKFLVD